MRSRQASESYNSIVCLGVIVIILLLAIGGMTIGILVTMNNAWHGAQDTFSRGSIQSLIRDSIPMEDIQELIQGSLSPVQFQTMIMQLIQTPQFQQALQAAVASVFQSFGAGAKRDADQEKRYDWTCAGISDPALCTKTEDMCKHLHKCVETYNITECQYVGTKAYAVCLGEGF